MKLFAAILLRGLSRTPIHIRALVAVWISLSGAVVGAENTKAPGYFELRCYSVTSNKLDAVLERFRDTVEPVRRKRGITTIGFWTAPGATNGGTFAYLLAASSREELQKQEKEFGADPRFKEGYANSNKKYGKTVDSILALPLIVDPAAIFDFSSTAEQRAFDLRIYSVLPGKLEAFRDRWRRFAVPIYERHGLHSVGWWLAEKKDADGNDLFVCLLSGKSVPSILQSISDLHQAPEWIRIVKTTEADCKLRSGVTSYKLPPTVFSALR